MPTGKGVESTIKAKRGTAALQIVWIPFAAIVVAVLASWLLKTQVERLLASAAVHSSDTMVLQWFRSRATPELDSVVQAFTLLGSPFAMMVYAFLGLSMLVNRRQWLLLFAWDVLFLGMWAITQTIKPILQRARPVGAEQFLNSMSYSFPSTHALSAVAGFGMMAFALAEVSEMEREPRAVLWMFTVALMIAIGISRLYLGVHYLSDVLAGFLAGGLWLLVCLFALNRARSQRAHIAHVFATPPS